MDFDFDMWANLYKEDPIAFDAKRIEVLAAEVNKAPEHLKESASKMLVLANMSQHEDPQKSILAAFKLMNNKLHELQYHQANLIAAMVIENAK